MGLFNRGRHTREAIEEGNPAQPSGWAVDRGDDVDDAAENAAREQQKRIDQVADTDEDNAHGQIHKQDPNPVQQVGPYAASLETCPTCRGRGKVAARQVTARVFVPPNARSLVGSRVLLYDHDSKKAVVGNLAGFRGNEFLVSWQDGRQTWEDKVNYEVVQK